MKKRFFIYSLFLILFTLFSYTFIDYNLFYLKWLYSIFSFENNLIRTSIYVIFLILFFVFYYLFYKDVKKGLIGGKEIRWLIGLTIIILLFSYSAMFSYDIFNYITSAKVLFFYRENPYLVMPIEFINEPYLIFTRAANKFALYGPFWLILTGIPYVLGFSKFILVLLNFKLFIIFFYLALVALIWKFSKNLLSVYLFALNPLVIIETLIGNHNDIVMMFFGLFSIYLIIKKKFGLAFLFFFLSVLIKYSTLLLLPVLFYLVWKEIKNQKINLEKVFLSSTFLMSIAFLSAPLREEIYPWYAIWFLTFMVLFPNKKFLLNLTIVFSFSLLLRYVPYIFSGSYFGMTPLLKIIVTFIPPLLFSLLYFFKTVLLRKEDKHLLF